MCSPSPRIALHPLGQLTSMVMLGQPGETVGQGRGGGGWGVGGARGPGPVNGKSERSALAPALSRLLIFFFPFGSHLRPTDRGHTAPCLPAPSKTHTHAHTHTHRTHTTPARHGPGAVGGGREARGGGRPCSPRRSQPRYPPLLCSPRPFPLPHSSPPRPGHVLWPHPVRRGRAHRLLRRQM